MAAPAARVEVSPSVVISTSSTCAAERRAAGRRPSRTGSWRARCAGCRAAAVASAACIVGVTGAHAAVRPAARTPRRRRPGRGRTGRAAPRRSRRPALAGELLHPHGRRVQQLVDDPVHGAAAISARVRSSRSGSRASSRASSAATTSAARARSATTVGATACAARAGEVGRDLVGDEVLRRLDVGVRLARGGQRRAERRRGRRRSTPGRSADRRVDVARQGEVDVDLRARRRGAAARPRRRRRRRRGRPRRCRRRRGRPRRAPRRAPSSGSARPPVRRGEPLGVVEGAVDDDEVARRRPRQRWSRPGAHRPGTDDEDAGRRRAGRALRAAVLEPGLDQRAR